MRFIHTLILFWFGFYPFLLAEAQLSGGKQLFQAPDVQAWLVGDAVHLDRTGAGTFRIAVRVPPDHHGYLDTGDEGLYLPLAFTFAPIEARGGRVVMLARPDGTRDKQAGATVLRGTGEFVFRLETQSTALLTDRVLPATLRAQICNDITNICYPPRMTNLPLRIAAVPGITHGAPAQAGDVSAASLTFHGHITALLQRAMGNLALAFALVTVVGLLAAATLCVYPLIPASVARLAAHAGGSRRRGCGHAVAYGAGVICLYSLLALVTAMTGTALAVLITHAWVNLGFALLFASLGLSMLGVYELQFLAALSMKLETASSHRSGVTGTFLMGVAIGLVMSPYIGPLIGAILLESTGHAAAARVTTSAIARGIVLMAGLSMGLGLPFLVVGWLSHRLPQLGVWLIRVKRLLGLLVLSVAYIYYAKAMENAGVPDRVAHAMLVGLVAIIAAVFIGALHHLDEPPRRSMLLRRACGIILLVIGVHFLYNGLGRSGILIPSPPAMQNESTRNISAPTVPPRTPQQPEVFIQGNLSWIRDLPIAQARASAEQKPLFVDFYATWCANCQAFERLAIRNTRLNSALQQAVLVKIYDTDPAFPSWQQDRRFPELRGVGGQPFLPLFAIFSPQGALVWKGQDYKAVQTMVVQLERAKRMPFRNPGQTRPFVDETRQR